MNRLLGWTLALGALAGVACRAGDQQATVSSLSATTVSPNRAKLIFGSVEVPVELSRLQQGDVVTFDWMAFGETIESESYEFNGESMALIAALGEDFRPGLPLLGQKSEAWSWKGTVESGGIKRPATASVKKSSGSVDYSQSRLNATLIAVDLEIGDPPMVGKRALKFFFVPGKGLIRREFGMGSIRTADPEAGQ